jgi:Flp pilus assembly protein TadG
MVEAALVLPIVIVMVLGCVDFGMYNSDRDTLAHAARYGARYASTHSIFSNTDPGSAASIQGQIETQTGNVTIHNNSATSIIIAYLNADGSSCGTYSTAGNAVTPSSCVAAGNIVKITIKYTYTPITPVVNFSPATGFPISETTEMVVLQ